MVKLDKVIRTEMTIGSDPEFIIFDSQKNIVSAKKVFGGCLDCNPCDKCGIKKCTGNRRKCGACEDCEEECDYCTVCDECDFCRDELTEGEVCSYCVDCIDNQDIILNGEIGCDGCSEVGEFRPLQGNDPNDHHDNITHLIEQIDIPDKFTIHAGTLMGGYTIGGHIHLGIPKLVGKRVDSLAIYLSKFAGTLLRKIEIPEHLLQRGLNEYGYGKYGSFNVASYGIEWRMPASWLVSSEIALSALSLAYIVGSEYIISPEIFRIPSLQIQKQSISSLNNTPRLINKIESMNKYAEYREELEPLFQMLVNGEKWDTDMDMREAWL